MSNSMPFTEQEIQQVFDTNLIEYALSQGFDLKKADRHSYQVRKSGGLTLFDKGYYHFSTKEKGNIIDFAKEYQGFTFIQAVENILGVRAYAHTISFQPVTQKEERGIMKLPTSDGDTTKTIQYLTEKRCLDKKIVRDLIQQGSIFEAITEHKGMTFHNCGFVGRDKENVPKYCALRGFEGSFRQDVKHSDKSYGFVMKGTGNRVFVFESPIDAISHATLCKLNSMDYTADYRISEGCLSDIALSRFLKTHPHITNIVFCFDNDVDGKYHKGNPFNHGQEFAKKCVSKFEKQGYKTYIQTPQNKDFNADLQYIQKSVLKKLKELQPVSGDTARKKQEKER